MKHDVLDKAKLEKVYREQLYLGKLEESMLEHNGRCEDFHFLGKTLLLTPLEENMFGSSSEEEFMDFPNVPIAIQKGVSVRLVKELRERLEWIHVHSCPHVISIKMLPINKYGIAIGVCPNPWNVFNHCYPDFVDEGMLNIVDNQFMHVKEKSMIQINYKKMNA